MKQRELRFLTLPAMGFARGMVEDRKVFALNAYRQSEVFYEVLAELTRTVVEPYWVFSQIQITSNLDPNREHYESGNGLADDFYYLRKAYGKTEQMWRDAHAVTFLSRGHDAKLVGYLSKDCVTGAKTPNWYWNGRFRMLAFSWIPEEMSDDALWNWVQEPERKADLTVSYASIMERPCIRFALQEPNRHTERRICAAVRDACEHCGVHLEWHFPEKDYL